MRAEATVDGNLGDVQQDRRLRLGVGMFTLGLLGAVVMLKLGAPALLRLSLFVPFSLGSAGIYMGLYGT